MDEKEVAPPRERFSNLKDAASAASKQVQDAVDGVGPAMGRAADQAIARTKGAAAGASRQAQQAFDAVGPALDRAGDKAYALTKQAADAGVIHFTLLGRMIDRSWREFQAASNPPWTLKKVAGWVLATLLVASTWIVIRAFRYGVLSLPILEEAGVQFATWAVSFGPVGLFAFTAVSTLFFMLIPTEPFFFLVLATSGNVVPAIVAAALGSTVGSCANWGFGRRLRRRSVQDPREEKKLTKWGARAHSKAGGALLFVAATLPMPEIVALGYGVADYPFKKFTLITLAGRFVKWTWVTLVFVFFNATF